jgi:alkylation response protein AidB-like acyl-CoA dehydrogenase
VTTLLNGHRATVDAAIDAPTAMPAAPREELRSRVRRFAAEVISPTVLEHDELGTSALAAYRGFWEQGFARPFLPRPEGGESPYLVDGCIVAEELAYACAATASLIMLPTFLNRMVLANLGEPVRSRFLDRVASEPVVTSFAASERAAGSDLLGVETSATATANGDGYMLEGRKEYSSNLRHAAYVIVVARTGPPSGRSSDALTWFLVPTDTPGVEVGDRWKTLGLRSMDLSPLELDGVYVPVDHRLGAEGAGLPLMLQSLGQSRTGIAAMAVGIARRARDEVLAYGTKRRLYGDKLVKLQDYRFRIADMEKDIAAARALVEVSASRYDDGLDHAKEASIAKLYAGQMVMRVTEAASVMLGSVGYTGQSLVEKLFLDARHTAIVEGTEPIHKELIFANVLRRGGY